MSDPATRRTIVAGAPTVTPRPGEAPRPTIAERLPTPNLPMATPYATPRPEGGIFVDNEIGFRVDYPFFWNRSSAAVPGTMVQLANQPDNVFVLILRTPIEAGQSLETAAGDLHERIGEWIGGLETVSSAASTVGAGLPAWRSEHELTYEIYDVTVRALVVSVAHGRQLISLAAYGQDQDLGAERETVEKIFASITLSEPRIYGVPRSEAYVYADGEWADARVYDPAIGQGDRRVFSGLVSLDPQLALRPELAESWDISPDGTVYTFYLRPGARFHDGRPLTAQDVVYSWERAVDPATGSEIALTYLGDIVGVAERRAGAAEAISGLRAVDPGTLEVTIDGPKPYFLLKLTASPAMVVDRANVESRAEWYRNPNGTGPYRLTRWEPGRVKIYERSEGFYGEPPPTRYLIARLDLAYSGLYEYMLDELDQLTLESYQLAWLRDSEEPIRADLREVAPLCTSFVSFDTTRPPFDDPKVRQAFALAVDRQRYQERALQGANIPARGLFPPGLPGHDPAFAGVPFDPEQARQRLAESRYGGAAGLPPITLTSDGYGFSVEPGVGVLVQMWQENLGATLKIEQLEPQVYNTTVQTRQRGNLFFWEWCADYPDPENFADALFHSQAQQNVGRYSNPDLDGLLQQARTEADLARRLEIYRQAEAMLVEDAAAIFLDHRIDAMLVAPRVSGPASAPGTVPVERYLTINREAGAGG